MKYFFTAGIQTASGDGMSNTSVKDMIADMFKQGRPDQAAFRPGSGQDAHRKRASSSPAAPWPSTGRELNILPSNLRKVY